MGQTEQNNQWDFFEKTREQLKDALGNLAEKAKSRLESKYGLSENFSSQVISEEAAMEMCARAMQTLEEDFVVSLEKFMTSATPSESLDALEEAETIWQTETKIIKDFDASGEEAAFLGEMREQSFQVLANKLEATAKISQTNTSKENIALCLSIMGIMDLILEERGCAITHPDRKAFREIAKSFMS